ncbi:MAG: DUF928 domain-containing protein [Nostocaceae cyanobacterium]|nr:DUF928 domain-containing protein [Nostocaceae cyanobacterium]
MINLQKISWKIKLMLAILFALIALNISHLKITAQAKQSKLSPVLFKRPILSSRGAPGDRKGGGRRNGDNCPILDINEHITALVPNFQDTKKVNHVWGLTTQESPSFWFYIPYNSKDITSGELEIWDETNPNPRNYQQIYQGKFSLTATPGIISLNLPPEIKIKSSKNYHWYLSVNVNCSSRNIPIIVNGWIEKVQEIALPIGQQSKREQALFYAQKGIWYDALTILGKLRRQKENSSVAVDWEKLLSDVGLENQAKKSIVKCCTLHN